MSRQQPLAVISFLFTSLFIWSQRSHPATAALYSAELSFHSKLGIYGVLAATRPSYSSPSGSEQPLNPVTVGSRVVLWKTSVYVTIPLRGPWGELLLHLQSSLLIPRLWRHRCRQPAWMEAEKLVMWWKYVVQAPIQCAKVGLMPHFNKKCV